MKAEYASLPDSMAQMKRYGFSWMEFVAAIPSPLFVVTSRKSNGLPNASLQSWATFTGAGERFYALLSSVNRNGHLYRTLHENGQAVLNFMSADIYDRCMETVKNNGFDVDEITASGLTVEEAGCVDAPRIRECFLHLECRYSWEREIVPGDPRVLVCLEVVNICAEREALDETVRGRYGKTGYLYNIHHPVSPENFGGTSHDWVGVLEKIKDMGEY